MNEEIIDKKPSIDTSIEVNPQNPFSMEIPLKEGEVNENVGYPGFAVEPERAGFFESAKEEFKNLSTNFHLLHGFNEPLTKPAGPVATYLYPDINDKFYQPAPDGWSPKQEIDKLSNLDPKFIPLLLKSRNPQDFNFMMDSINEQSHRDQVLENGSTLGKIFGGLVGLSPIGSIEDFIPLAAFSTKAKVAGGFISGMRKSFPGILTASAVREGAAEIDKVDGNISNFLKDTFIDAAFGTVFFGAIGAGKSIINIAEMNKLKKFSRDYLDGVGFNFKVDKSGNLLGFEAVDTTGGSLSAAKLTRAQEHADAAFHKGGLFKIPYLGTGALAVISGNIPGFKYLLGSPLIQLLTSKYKAAAAFANSAFDHFITTQGEAKGGTRPLSFEARVKQTRADLTKLRVLTNALHAERNGYKIKARPTLALQNAWSAVKQKSMEALAEQSESDKWVNEKEFLEEVANVIRTKEPSEHAAVNTLASAYKKIRDDTAYNYLEAYGLPKDYFKDMETFISRVYDTEYLNLNKGDREGKNPNGWIPVISNFLKESDEIITQRMLPITTLETQIKQFEAAHKQVIENLPKKRLPVSGIAPEHKTVINTLDDMRERLKYLKEDLQNELRSNPEYKYHIDDRNALSADESKELKGLLKPLNEIKKKIESQQIVVSNLKEKRSSQLSRAKKSETEAKTLPKAEKYIKLDKDVKKAEDLLNEYKRNLQDEEYRLYDLARSKKVNPRFYNPITHEYVNPKNRLKFRKVYDNHIERQNVAEGYYDSIMNMNPQDIINDMFSKITGAPNTNPLKARSILIPDTLLADYNFLSKDLYSTTANYVNFLSKRTHLKNSFKESTISGDFEEIAVNLLDEHKYNNSLIEDRKAKLLASLEGKSEKEQKFIQKQIEAENKKLKKEKIDFNNIKTVMKRLYENRMMGINRRDDFDNMARRTWMSLTSAANLHNLPATQITDFAFGGFQHGIWPFIRDGIYPIMQSLGGILKTKDSEALREMAPHIGLGYQDMLNNYADRNWHSELQPYINMGRISSGIEKFAHFSALTDGSPYIDNGLQHTFGSIIQSKFMQLLHKEVEGKLSEKESLYLRKYGIDPKEWAKRMVDAYKQAGGIKTKLGGYMSKSWMWEDLEASKVFNDSVFRGIQNTLVWKGMADSPFFADNLLGMFFHTFTGWTYAATNRYLIPSLQHPDAELLLKMVWMMGAGAMVSPMRRLSRGEDAWPDDMTDTQIAYEAFTDSGVFSSIGNVLNLANFLSSDKLLGDLKNDKFKNRAKTGIFGISDVISSTASRISDVLGMAIYGLNEKDMKTAAHMLPITGAMYGHYISDKIIENANLPRNKRAAELQNG